MFDRALAALRGAGWRVQPAPEPRLFPPALATRYPNVASSPLYRFLGRLDACASPSDTVWFLTANELTGASGSAFRYDEWERLSLDSAGGNRIVENATRAFWDRHFPFLMSVRSGYAYLALCADGESSGAIVSGAEPEFEQVRVIATSFDQFLQDLVALLQRGDVHLDGFL